VDELNWSAAFLGVGALLDPSVVAVDKSGKYHVAMEPPA
jgi:hypothetical protein